MAIPINPVERQKIVLFWSTTDVPYGVFSNFYPSHFVDDAGNRYKWAEQYLMKAKADLFGDKKIALQILHANSPTDCKALGRIVSNFDDSIWIQHARNIMRQGLMLKFSQNEYLKQILLSTENAIIAEASPRDYRWGIGMSKTHKNALDPTKWNGTNWLGYTLMEVRNQL